MVVSGQYSDVGVSRARAATSSPIAALMWGVQVVLDDHERLAELLVRGIQQPGVIGPVKLSLSAR